MATGSLSQYYLQEAQRMWNGRSSPEVYRRLVENLQVAALYSDSQQRNEIAKTIEILKAERSLRESERETNTNFPRAQSSPSSSLPHSSRRGGDGRADDEEISEERMIAEGVLAVSRPEANFARVVGLDRAKEEFSDAVEFPIKHAEAFAEYGCEQTSGVCLYGPAGCGKTAIVAAAAGQYGLSLIVASPGRISSKWYGDSEKRIRICFDVARKNAPSLLVFDEADKFLGNSESTVQPRIISEVLQQWDGLLTKRSKAPMMVVLLSNEPWKLSQAILRPGRVDRLIYLPPPDDQLRERLFQIYLDNPVGVSQDIDYRRLSDFTRPTDLGYYSSSAIRTICGGAKRLAAKESIESHANYNSGPKKRVSMAHVENAISTTKPSISHDEIRKYTSWGKRASYAA